MSTPLPILSEQELALIQRKELENAITKLNSGGSLTRRELDIINAAAARSKPSSPPPPPIPSPAAAAPLILTPSAAAAPAPLSRGDIATLYADSDGTPLSLRTIDRVNHIATLPDVGIPAPWHDAAALAVWFRSHYRSDPTKPARAKPRALPAWLENAVRRAPGSTPPLAPAPAARETSADQPSAPAPLPAEEIPPPADQPLLIDPIAFARQLVDAAQAKYNAVRHNPAESDSARRAYFDSLEKLQQAEDRARKAGTSDDLRREVVAEHLQTLHGRIVRTFIRELTAARGEAMRASVRPEEWAAWVADTVHSICRRLVSARFEEPPVPQAAAA